MIITTANCYVKKQSYSDYAPLLPRMRWFATKTVYIVTVKNIDMCKGITNFYDDMWQLCITQGQISKIF